MKGNDGMQKTLCENCLELTSETAIRIGPDMGNQRDSFYDKMSLCAICKKALLGHDLENFNSRFATERTINRNDVPPE